MKVPPTNNSISGFDSYEEEVYFPDGSPTHAPVQNGVDDYPPVEDSDFSEYMWMENEEEFDKEVSLYTINCTRQQKQYCEIFLRQ